MNYIELKRPGRDGLHMINLDHYSEWVDFPDGLPSSNPMATETPEPTLLGEKENGIIKSFSGPAREQILEALKALKLLRWQNGNGLH